MNTRAGFTGTECGVVDGFYGRPWNARQRHHLLQTMRRLGLGLYLYAPKDDPWHRFRWSELYPETALNELAALIRDTDRHGIQFIYAIAPGLDIRFSNEADLAALETKLAQIAELGVRHFALLFDDIPLDLNPADRARFGSTAAAQAHATARIAAFLHGRGIQGRLLMCPTVYCSRMSEQGISADPYLAELGRSLPESAEVVWTGPEIVSPELTRDHLAGITRALGRRVIVWDNLFANDYDPRRCYLGPYSGREPSLPTAVTGILVNLNCQYELNAIPLRTFAEFASVGSAYNPEAAFARAREEWQSFFAASGVPVFSREEMEALCGMHYLPYTQGPAAVELLAQLDTFLADPDGVDPTGLLERLARVAGLLDKLTRIDERELAFALYPFCWELKEESVLLARYVRWAKAHPGTTGGFRSAEALPGVFRGGIIEALRRRLTMQPDGTFIPNRPTW